MVYTEVKINGKVSYYYRAASIRKGKLITKKRIYLGKNLSKNKLQESIQKADKQLQPPNSELELMKPVIIKTLKKYHVKKAGIFGSYARGEQKKASDIDLLVQYPKNMGFDAVSLHNELEKVLNKKVDLVSYKYINPLLKEKILLEEKELL